MKNHFDWHDLNDGLAVVFTTDDEGQQDEEIASGSPVWIERIAEALNVVHERACVRPYAEDERQAAERDAKLLRKVGGAE